MRGVIFDIILTNYNLQYIGSNPPGDRRVSGGNITVMSIRGQSGTYMERKENNKLFALRARPAAKCHVICPLSGDGGGINMVPSAQRAGMAA